MKPVGGAGPPMAESLLGVVLAGGQGRRFGDGSDAKAVAEVGGVRMVDRAIEALRPHVADVGAVLSPEGELGPLDVPIRRDETPGRGPLEGLRVALAWARDENHDGVVVLACDLPLFDADAVGRLVAAHRVRPGGALTTVPEAGGRPHPLSAVYALGALQTVELRLGEGDRSLTALLDHLEARPVPAESLAIDLDALLNVNTLEQLALARRRAGDR